MFCQYEKGAREEAMAKVYVEPRPKGRSDGCAITDYVIEDRTEAILHTAKTQQDAIDWARRGGHHPVVPRVRTLNDKNNPDHWRPA
jgi:hypothetical protein